MKRIIALSALWVLLGFAVGCLWSNWYWQNKFLALEGRARILVNRALEAGCSQVEPEGGVTVTIDGKKQ